MKNKGFTLIELLVVITIIGILMGILLPAVGAAFKKAKEARANTEVRAIETAMKAYLQEYGKFPLQDHMDHDQLYNISSTHPSYSNLVSILRGENKEVKNKKWNMRNILFLEVGEDSIYKGDDPSKAALVGLFVDPWEEAYQVKADWDFDNNVDGHQGRNVTVSTGNGEIATWK